MRVFSRTRWWWTAAVISSDGIGARFSSQSRSDSTMIRAPAAIALRHLGPQLLDGLGERACRRR